jgi:hypothetical protein
LVDNYFGLKLNFSIAGAPENNVEQVFFYLSRTSDIATHLHEESITLLEEFAVLFEIEANAKTAEGLAAIAGSARKVDPATMSHPQKEWLASNIDDLVGVGFGIARLADCAGSFVGAISAAADDVEQNPAIVLGYFDSIGDALDDANRLLDAAPGLSNAVEIISTVVELGKAEGIEPPSKVQARLLADKAATSAIGEEVTFS